ncbi:Regulatory protein AfsR [Actinosynnema sp. ALI-1.44]
MLLDDARDADQVAPLLPGGRTCVTLVTSRNTLSGLVVGHGAHRVPLGVLTAADSRALLGTWIGERRLDAEPAAARELVAHCAGLPLALSIVAARAHTYPDFPLAEVAAGLRHAAVRLNSLDDDDTRSSLPVALSWSYEALTGPQAEAFRLLGVAPTPEIGLAAAASLVGTSRDRVRSLLAALERTSLVQRCRPDRFRMHDLVHLYAAQAPWPDDRSVERGEHRAAWLIGWALTNYHWRRGHLHDQLDTLGAALAATGHLDEPAARVQVLRNIGRTYSRLGDHAQAVPHLQEALQLAGRIGDHLGQAHTHRYAAKVFEGLGDVTGALEHAGHALRLSTVIGDPVWQADAVVLKGECETRLGRHDEAHASFTRAVHLFRRHDYHPGEALALVGLGDLARRRGDHPAAVPFYDAALSVFRAVGHAFHEADTLHRLGEIHEALGDHAAVQSRWRQALGLFRAQRRSGRAQETTTCLARARHP